MLWFWSLIFRAGLDNVGVKRTVYTLDYQDGAPPVDLPAADFTAALSNRVGDYVGAVRGRCPNGLNTREATDFWHVKAPRVMADAARWTPEQAQAIYKNVEDQLRAYTRDGCDSPVAVKVDPNAKRMYFYESSVNTVTAEDFVAKIDASAHLAAAVTPKTHAQQINHQDDRAQAFIPSMHVPPFARFDWFNVIERVSNYFFGATDVIDGMYVSTQRYADYLSSLYHNSQAIFESTADQVLAFGLVTEAKLLVDRVTEIGPFERHAPMWDLTKGVQRFIIYNDGEISAHHQSGIVDMAQWNLDHGDTPEEILAALELADREPGHKGVFTAWFGTPEAFVSRMLQPGPRLPDVYSNTWQNKSFPIFENAKNNTPLPKDYVLPRAEMAELMNLGNPVTVEYLNEQPRDNLRQAVPQNIDPKKLQAYSQLENKKKRMRDEAPGDEGVRPSKHPRVKRVLSSIPARYLPVAVQGLVGTPDEQSEVSNDSLNVSEDGETRRW